MACSKKVLFLEKVLPQATKLPGTSGFFKKKSIFWKKSAPGSEAARDKWLLQKEIIFSAKSSSPGSEAARDKWLLQKKDRFGSKSSAPGSEAARDKWLRQEKQNNFLLKVLPQAAKLPGTSGLFKQKIVIF